MNDPSPALPELKGREQDLKFSPLDKGGLRGVISTFARGLFFIVAQSATLERVALNSLLAIANNSG